MYLNFTKETYSTNNSLMYNYIIMVYFNNTLNNTYIYTSMLYYVQGMRIFFNHNLN